MNTALLKERIKGHVSFARYHDGALWYTAEDGFEFPVPISDIGNATFLCRDKAMLFMRYISRHMKMLDETRAQHEQASA